MKTFDSLFQLYGQNVIGLKEDEVLQSMHLL